MRATTLRPNRSATLRGAMANVPPVSIQIARGVEVPSRPASLRRWARATLDYIDQSGALCIRVVGADEMTDLNARFRHKRGTTNVLSFPADADDYAGEARQLGDVAICAPVVVSEAAAQGKRAADHLAQRGADEQEHAGLEQEDHHIPERGAAQSHCRGKHAVLVPAADQAAHDGGDDAGDVHVFRRDVGGPAHQHRGGDHQVLIRQPSGSDYP